MFVGPLGPMQGIIYDDDHNGLDGLAIQSKAMDLAAIRLEGFQYNHSSEVYLFKRGIIGCHMLKK